MRLRLAIVAAPLLTGCSGWQSALDPQEPQAKHLADLIWGFSDVCTAVWILVMIVLAAALLRRRGERLDPLATDASSDRRILSVIGACAAATAAIVFGLTVLSYVSQRALYAQASPAVTLKVTGHQWWWDLRYE